jgi:hypothetical protein
LRVASEDHPPQRGGKPSVAGAGEESIGLSL